MRLKVRHETTYHYGAAARSAIQMLRMTPRSSGSQFVRRWRVEVDADARLDRDEDAFGNITHTVFLAGPLLSVKVTVEGEVDTTDANGIVSGTVERQPPALILRDTALTQPSPELRAYARACAADAGTDQLAAMHSLMERLADDISFDSSATTSSTTAAQAFVARRGVCQDFAICSLPVRAASACRRATSALSAERPHRPERGPCLGRNPSARHRLGRIRRDQSGLRHRSICARRSRARLSRCRADPRLADRRHWREPRHPGPGATGTAGYRGVMPSFHRRSRSISSVLG